MINGREEKLEALEILCVRKLLRIFESKKETNGQLRFTQRVIYHLLKAKRKFNWDIWGMSVEDVEWSSSFDAGWMLRCKVHCSLR